MIFVVDHWRSLPKGGDLHAVMVLPEFYESHKMRVQPFSFPIDAWRNADRSRSLRNIKNS